MKKSDFSRGDSFLIVVDPDKYNDAISFLTSFKERVLYISLNKPCSSINAKDNYFVISAIEGDKCPHINDLQSLTNLSILITNIVESKKFDYLILDSVTTLLTYNDFSMTLRFLHFLVNRMRALHVKPILIIDSSQDKVINQIIQLVSKTIRE